MNKRIVGFWMFFLVPIPICSTPDNTAYQFLFNLYSNYQNGNVGFRYNGTAADTIFSPELLKLIRKDQKLAQGEVGYLDFNPMCACQDISDFKVIKIVIFKKLDTTYADLRFKISETKDSLLLKLQTNNGRWLIGDIISHSGSLYGFLSASLSDNNPNSIYKNK